MLKRLSYAFVGACCVTVVLILVMSEIAKFFERPDSQVYMRVMDFIPGSGARRLPDKRMPETQPERARVGSGEIAPDRVGSGEIAPDRVGGTAAPLRFEQDSRDIEVSIDLDPTPDD